MKTKMILKQMMLGGCAGVIGAAGVYFIFQPLPETPMTNTILLAAFALLAIYKLISGYVTGSADLRLSAATIEENPKMYAQIQIWWWIIFFFIVTLEIITALQ